MSNLEGFLVTEQWVTADELVKAKEDQKRTQKSLYASFIKLGYMTEDDVFLFFSEHSSFPFIRLSDYAIQEAVVGLVPEDFCREHLVLPLFKVGLDLFVAMVNPLDTSVIMDLGERTQLAIQPVVAAPHAIMKALDEYLGYPETLFAMEKFLFKPQGLAKFPFHRASERIPLAIPLEFTVDDAQIQLAHSQYIPATTIDISRNMGSLGIKTFLYIPAGIQVSLRFITAEPNTLEAQAETVHSRMAKGGAFLMGLRFRRLAPEVKSYLAQSAGR